MKKQKTTSKISLIKETVAKFESKSSSKVKGGGADRKCYNDSNDVIVTGDIDNLK